MPNDDIAHRVTGREFALAYLRAPSRTVVRWGVLDRLTSAAYDACESRRRAEALAARIVAAGGEAIDPADLVAAAYELERIEGRS